MTPLKKRLIAQIRQSGPISISGFMAQCLLDPTHGYYPTRDPLGIDGDFITAPEISQMFGEVVGLWVINAWRALGAPKLVHLVEYGPGRGVMMSDILKATRLDPNCHAALHVHLIETSAALEGKQAAILSDYDVPIDWVGGLQDIPCGPTIILGNEYLDCLPIRQFIVRDRFAGKAGLHERMVDIHPDNPQKLIYTVRETPIAAADMAALPDALPDLKTDDLFELNTGLAHMVEALQTRFESAPGTALFIDYGPEQSETGDSFQALQSHKKVYPLDNPGEADLTARVDFTHLCALAETAGLAVYGPVTQAEFLSRLGLEMRAVALSRQNPQQKDKIARQLNRLTGAEEMGQLFKAICIQSPDLAVPLGFSDPA